MSYYNWKDVFEFGSSKVSKNPAYGLNLTFLFPGILKIAMIGFVIYCISIILLMIDSFCQKISGSMLLPYVFLQSLMGITLLACSIILNLIFTVLRYPHWNFVLDMQLLTIVLTIVAVIFVFKKKSPYFLLPNICLCNLWKLPKLIWKNQFKKWWGDKSIPSSLPYKVDKSASHYIFWWMFC